MKILDYVKSIALKAFVGVGSVLLACFSAFILFERKRNDNLESENQKKDFKNAKLESDLHVADSSLSDLVSEHNAEIQSRDKSDSPKDN